MPLSQVEQRKVLDLIERNGSKIFKVTFRRRTEKRDEKGNIIARVGDLRTMVCRVKVKSALKQMNNPAERKGRDLRNTLLTVFEMAGEDSGYKSIPLDSIEELVINP